MLRRVFGRSPVQEPDEAALLDELHGQVEEATLQAYVGTSELPSGLKAGDEVDCLLLRYLRAEKKNVAKAAKRLERQAAWRRGFGAVGDAEVAAELATGKVKLQLPAAGSSGRPLIIIKGKHHKPGATPQLMNNFIFYCLEGASHYCWHPDNPDGKLVAVFDLAGLQLKNLDAAALRASFAMLEQHFPERISEIWMYEAPTIFWGIWKLVYPFIDSSTRSRIHFVYGKKAQEQMAESLGRAILPLEYGGTAAETAVEAAVQQLPGWRAQQRLDGEAAGGEGEALAKQAQAKLRLSGSSPTLATEVEASA